MRANVMFLVALLAISSVVSMKTSFSKMYADNSEYKRKVDEVKKTNLGKIIINLAQLHQTGKFGPLFDAIDDLQDFLADQLLKENADFAQITSQWQLDTARLNDQISDAQAEVDADNSDLESNLYPSRDSYIFNIAGLKDNLQDLNDNKDQLDADRAQEVAEYQSNLDDFNAGIASLKQALPFLSSLVNDVNFLEVNAEQFQKIAKHLSKSLGKLKYGNLYTSFVQTLVKSLQNKISQEGLNAVIGQVQTLLDNLQNGLVNLQNDEARNAAAYAASSQVLADAIQQTAENLAADEQSLAEDLEDIANEEQDRDSNVDIVNSSTAQLAAVQDTYADRVQAHGDFLDQVAAEQSTIQQAVDVLNQGGVSRSA